MPISTYIPPIRLEYIINLCSSLLFFITRMSGQGRLQLEKQFLVSIGITRQFLLQCRSQEKQYYR